MPRRTPRSFQRHDSSLPNAALAAPMRRVTSSEISAFAEDTTEIAKFVDCIQHCAVNRNFRFGGRRPWSTYRKSKTNLSSASPNYVWFVNSNLRTIAQTKRFLKNGRKSYSVITNSAEDCRILQKFGTYVHRGSTKTVKW